MRGHGTRVAGLAGGKTYGIAKDAILHSVNVAADGPYCHRGIDIAKAIAGLEWVARTHPKGQRAVINMSFGGPASPTFQSAVRDIINYNNIPVVAAAGNRGRNYCYLGRFNSKIKSVINVGATRRYDYKYDGSNFGPCVDIFAPGQDVVAAGVGSDDAITPAWSGTSGSAPLVAGAVASYLEVYPYATVAEVQQALIDASTKNKIEDIYTWTWTPNRLLYTPDLPPPSIIISAESVYLGNSMLFAVNGAIPHKLVYWLMGDGSLVYGRSRFNYTYKTRGYKNVRLVAFDKYDAVGNAVTATAYKQVYVYGNEAILPPIYRLLLH